MVGPEGLVSKCENKPFSLKSTEAIGVRQLVVFFLQTQRTVWSTKALCDQSWGYPGLIYFPVAPLISLSMILLLWRHKKHKAMFLYAFLVTMDLSFQHILSGAWYWFVLQTGQSTFHLQKDHKGTMLMVWLSEVQTTCPAGESFTLLQPCCIQPLCQPTVLQHPSITPLPTQWSPSPIPCSKMWISQ